MAVLVHVKVVPAVGLLKLMAAPAAPLHKFTAEIPLTVATGRTVTLNVVGTPGQPLTEGVTVTSAVTLDVPLFTAVKLGILPDPEVPKPTFVELIHVKTAPPLELLKLIPLVPAPLQAVTLLMALTVATGFT